MVAGPADPPPGEYADFVMGHWDQARRQGKRCAILTIVGNTGSSPRPLGSQLAISEDGRFVGLISGGCVEASLVRDALQAMSDDRSYVERYGAGSRFIDLRLPCGSGIDIHFDVHLPDALGQAIVEARHARIRSDLMIDTVGHGHALTIGEPGPAPKAPAGGYVKTYYPACRLILAGVGPIALHLARLCAISEIEVNVVTTDRLTADALVRAGFPVSLVARWKAHDWNRLDPYSALVILAHDHDDELDILLPVLAGAAFYIGALGSRKTHDRRCASLRKAGIAEDAIARIRGPVGLRIGAATPPEIAVSILGELIGQWRMRLNGAVPSP